MYVYKHTPGKKMRVKMYIDFLILFHAFLLFVCVCPVPYTPHTALPPVLEESYTLLNLTKI